MMWVNNLYHHIVGSLVNGFSTYTVFEEWRTVGKLFSQARVRRVVDTSNSDCISVKVYFTND